MHPEYLSTLREWAQKGLYSDLLLTCKGYEFLVHRVIVCAHSRFFQAACDGNFKESLTNTIDLDDDLESVKRMICYMYTFDYDDPKPAAEDLTSDTEHIEQDEGDTYDQESATDPELFSSVRVYAIAAKYGIAALQDLARTRFAEWMAQNWRSAQCPAMAAEVFASTPMEDTGLKDIVADIVARQIASLVGEAAWEDVIVKNDQLGRKIMSQLAILQTETRSELEDVIQDQAVSIQRLEVQRDMLIARLAAVSDGLNRHKHCRHCDMKFNVYMESVEHATLRCRDCKTRHY